MKLLNVGCALLPLVSSTAIPAKKSSNTIIDFGLIALHSASPIHLSSINASGNKFWIGKDTTTYCPAINELDCSQFKNTTAFSAATNSDFLGMVSPQNPLSLSEPAPKK